MPFGWGESQDSYQQVYDQDQPDHEGKFSHELLAGGAGFAAMKIFEDHQRKEGKPVSHQFAKELIAGFAAGEVDKLCETKGADYIDREKAKRHARENAEQMYDDHYGDQGKSPTPYPGSCAVTNSSTDQYNPNQQQPNDRLQQQFGRW